MRKKSILEGNIKYYFAEDIGLRNARINFRQVEYTHIMENIIYTDLLRRGYNVDVGVVKHDFKKDGNKRKVQLDSVLVNDDFIKKEIYKSRKDNNYEEKV